MPVLGLAVLLALPVPGLANGIDIYWCRWSPAPDEAIESLWRTRDGSVPLGLGYLGRCARPERDAPAVPHLMAYLSSKHSFHRRWLAVRALARLGPAASRTSSLLASMLGEEDERLRLAASVALLRVAPEHAEASKARRQLARALASRDPAVRSAAVEVIGALGEEGVQMLPADPAFGEWGVFQALAEIGTPPAVDRLFSGLRDEDSIMANRAAQALSEVGDYRGQEAAARVSGRLRQALAGPVPSLRAGAARTLYYLGSGGWAESRPCVSDTPEPPGCQAIRDSVDLLVPLLSDPEQRVRVSAAGALDRLGPEAEAALPAVVTALNRTDVEAHEAFTMANTAAAIGRPIPDARRGIARLFAHEDGGIRMYAARALRETGTVSPWALEVLQEGLGDASLHVRVESAHALGKLTGEVSTVVPILAEARSSTASSEIRSWIDRVVDDLGPDAGARMSSFAPS